MRKGERCYNRWNDLRSNDVLSPSAVVFLLSARAKSLRRVYCAIVRGRDGEDSLLTRKLKTTTSLEKEMAFNSQRDYTWQTRIRIYSRPPMDFHIFRNSSSVRRGAEYSSLSEAHCVETTLPLPTVRKWPSRQSSLLREEISLLPNNIDVPQRTAQLRLIGEKLTYLE